jgi:hypothetical protein
MGTEAQNTPGREAKEKGPAKTQQRRGRRAKTHGSVVKEASQEERTWERVVHTASPPCLPVMQP